MTQKTWKAVELRIAKLFGTYRTPLSGISSRHTKSDTLHKNLFVEVKHKKKIPFLKLFKETIKKAREEKKIPLVVFVERNSRTPIVMCDINNLKEISSFLKDEK